MKGIISGIKRMEIHDGDGCRTTVFFKGCPLKCLWCHNPESISYQPQVGFFENKCIRCGLCRGERTPMTAAGCPVSALVSYGKSVTVDCLVDELSRDGDFFRNSGGGVTFSGGECLTQPEFVLAAAKKLAERGISLFVDTCGFVRPEIVEGMIPYTDRFLYDIKAVDAQVHMRCTGRDNKLILDNLKLLARHGCDVEIRYPLVKGYNDGECEKIGGLLQKIGIRRIKVLQYHAFSASRYDALGMECTLPSLVTTAEDVARAVCVLREYGLDAFSG